jgi:hypothetical protein
MTATAEFQTPWVNHIRTMSVGKCQEVLNQGIDDMGPFFQEIETSEPPANQNVHFVIAAARRAQAMRAWIGYNPSHQTDLPIEPAECANGKIDKTLRLFQECAQCEKLKDNKPEKPANFEAPIRKCVSSVNT